MKRRSIVLSVLVSCALTLVADARGQAAQREMGRIGCPRCRNDGSEVSRLLQQADELYTGFKTKAALKALLRVLELDPDNPEALSKIARVYVDFGDNIPETESNWQDKRLQQYRIAEDYARKAVKVDPNGTWGHFYVATSLGKMAVHSSVSQQIDLAEEIRTEVEKAIACDPQNGFAYHVYGVWHRRMAEIGKTSRLLASALLWRSIPKGSMETSVEYLKKAISLNSTVISHHLELAKTYISLGKWELPRASLKSSLAQPVQFSDDPVNKKEAEQLLHEVSGR